jgi:quinol monooxygenase YgiN
VQLGVSVGVPAVSAPEPVSDEQSVVDEDLDPARRREFLAALEPLTKGSLADPGCIQYTISADLDDPGRVHVVEQWESDVLMRAHMAAPHSVEFVKAMQPIGVRGVKVTKHEVSTSQPLRVG